MFQNLHIMEQRSKRHHRKCLDRGQNSKEKVNPRGRKRAVAERGERKCYLNQSKEKRGGRPGKVYS